MAIAIFKRIKILFKIYILSHMTILLLILIYVAFISLGLPDTLIGAIWPAMQTDLNVPLMAAGGLSVITSLGTIFSSLFSGRLIHSFRTGKVLVFSVFLTAFALFGFSRTDSFEMLCFFAIPLGVGAGAVDVALNNFVAIHYKAKHMNWLHSFWGIGATLGPMIMALIMGQNGSWQKGYFIIATFQFVLAFILIFSLPLWKKLEPVAEKNEVDPKTKMSLKRLFQVRGVSLSILLFVGYATLEVTTGLWSGTYLVKKTGFTPEDAAWGVSLMFAFMTFGRFFSGFLTAKFSNRQMIRLGLSIVCLGAFLLILPLPSTFDLIGVICIGLGCAPVYPAMLHETPKRFGIDLSKHVFGVQMAGFYIGALCLPPAFGIIADVLSIAYFPYFLMLFWVIIIYGFIRLDKVT